MELILKSFYKDKNILITGATGFKGAWLSYWLYILGARVTGIGYNPNKNKNLFYSLKLEKKIHLKSLDIRDKRQLSKCIKVVKPDIIFHLAAQPLIYESYKNPFLTYEVNALGTLNMLDCIKNNKNHKIRSVVFVTSDKCYYNNYSVVGFKEEDKLGGIDPYSGSKACAEIMINTYIESFFKKKKTIGIASARAGNVIGGGDYSPNRLIPDAIKSIANNKQIFLRNPKFNRPWQHVLEPLYGYLILGEKLYTKPSNFSGAWNFGTKKNTVTNVEEIIKIIIKFWGKGSLKVKKNNKFYEQENLQLNISKSEKLLNWKPKFSITESVEMTADWYKKILVNKLCPETVTKEQILRYMNIDQKN
jgi:CDP-glucose 4,6-dehydratase